MTVLVAAVDSTHQVLASDTHSFGSYMQEECGPKIAQLQCDADPMLWGATGSYLCLQWLQTHGQLLVEGQISGATSYLRVLDLWTQHQKWIRDEGHGKVGDDGELNKVTTALAVHGNQVFLCQANGSVLLRPNGFTAAGAGREAALGALHVTKRRGAKARCKSAVKAAIATSIYCGGNVAMLCLPR